MAGRKASSPPAAEVCVCTLGGCPKRSEGLSLDMKKRKLKWFIYILQCSDKSLYTGATTDLSRRLNEHNRKKGGGYTQARLPVKMVYNESYNTKSKALKREARIKGWTRKNKLALINCGKTS